MTPKAWLALSLVYVVWGSTYLAIRVVVRTMPPLLASGVRWTIAGIIMLAIGWRGLQGARPTRRQWRDAAIIGTALLLGGNGLVSVAEQRVESGMAALLIATVPLFIALFELAVYRVRPRKTVVLGIVVGFIGTAILVRPQDGGVEVDLVGALVLVAASCIWAGGSLFARRAESPAHPLVASGMQMVTGAAVIFAVASIGGEWGRVQLDDVSRSSVLALLYLILIGSLVGYTSYSWLIRNAKTSTVATYAYVNPLVAVILGALILDERVTTTTLVGGAVILGSVALIVASGAREAKLVADAPEPVGVERA